MEQENLRSRLVRRLLRVPPPNEIASGRDGVEIVVCGDAAAVDVAERELVRAAAAAPAMALAGELVSKTYVTDKIGAAQVEMKFGVHLYEEGGGYFVKGWKEDVLCAIDFLKAH
jgi:hypothetical protein